MEEETTNANSSNNAEEKQVSVKKRWKEGEKSHVGITHEVPRMKDLHKKNKTFLIIGIFRS